MAFFDQAVPASNQDELPGVPQVIFQPGTKLEEIERAVILETLKQQSYNRTHAARVLGIGIRTLQRKLKKYGAAGLGLKSVYMNN
jgi:DNA-binding NtrC family response regulator